MLLLLLRHAEAEPIAASDYDRPLTGKGLKQARQLAEFCSRFGIEPGLILTSPVLRAAETAQIFHRAHPEAQLVQSRSLACGMRPEQALTEIASHAGFDPLLLVGHEPDLGFLACHLLGVPGGDGIRIRKASLTGIDLAAFREGGGRLEFSIPVKFT